MKLTLQSVFYLSEPTAQRWLSAADPISEPRERIPTSRLCSARRWPWIAKRLQSANQQELGPWWWSKTKALLFRACSRSPHTHRRYKVIVALLVCQSLGINFYWEKKKKSNCKTFLLAQTSEALTQRWNSSSGASHVDTIPRAM